MKGYTYDQKFSFHWISPNNKENPNEGTESTWEHFTSSSPSSIYTDIPGRGGVH